MPTFDIVSLGEPLWELSQVPGDEERFLFGFGGDTSNTAIAAARLGARVAYVTRIGTDAFGERFLNLWRDEGVDASGVARDPDAPTGGYLISHGPDGHQFSYLRAGSAASRTRPQDLPRDLLRNARHFYCSAISQAISANACDTVFAAIEAARAAGAKFCFDSNLRLKLWPLARARAVICATIGQTDDFLPSLEDARVLSELESPQAILDWALAQGAARVALKLGADGVLATDGKERRHIVGQRVNAIDATGAGDCFAGAFLARLAAGDAYWPALEYANAAAALATTAYGAVAALPRDEAVRALLAA